MSNFEFLYYKATPSDQYMLGIASVRVYGKVVLRYKQINDKKGGFFFVPASYAITDDQGQKSYSQAFCLDSQAEGEMLQEFIRENVKKSLANGGQIQQKASVGGGGEPELPF